jgi:hypothetical protein
MDKRKPFEIFWFGDNGPNWIETVDTLEIAKERIQNLPQARLAGKLVSCEIDREPRAKAKPSDHTPIIAELGD